MVNFHAVSAALAVAASIPYVSGLPAPAFTHPVFRHGPHVSNNSIHLPCPTSKSHTANEFKTAPWAIGSKEHRQALLDGLLIWHRNVCAKKDPSSQLSPLSQDSGCADLYKDLEPLLASERDDGSFYFPQGWPSKTTAPNCGSIHAINTEGIKMKRNWHKQTLRLIKQRLKHAAGQFHPFSRKESRMHPPERLITGGTRVGNANVASSSSEPKAPYNIATHERAGEISRAVLNDCLENQWPHHVCVAMADSLRNGTGPLLAAGNAYNKMQASGGGINFIAKLIQIIFGWLVNPDTWKKHHHASSKASISAALATWVGHTADAPPAPASPSGNDTSTSNSTRPEPKQPKEINYASKIANILDEYAEGMPGREYGTWPVYFTPLFDQLKIDGYANGTARGNLTAEGMKAREKKYTPLARTLLAQTIFYPSTEWLGGVNILLRAMEIDGLVRDLRGKASHPSFNKSMIPLTGARPSYISESTAIVLEAQKHDYRLQETLGSFEPLLRELKKDGYMRPDSDLEVVERTAITSLEHKLPTPQQEKYDKLILQSHWQMSKVRPVGKHHLLTPYVLYHHMVRDEVASRQVLNELELHSILL
ncbi:hypothetical protein CKM354_000915400 [Cercospora kikuchii]|uniref:Uncharacterized protein n=1 Tax=Cercospora kikuchii TaxID=84275 RepID=A0A9P3CP21_9PEZI|nr:uncharacterized protein CKM354_000915400 [Cercospora kikuchii]GIZ46011.1 hypothetical protein CKM354_000915400 [Cercospora kikuchii]